MRRTHLIGTMLIAAIAVLLLLSMFGCTAKTPQDAPDAAASEPDKGRAVTPTEPPPVEEPVADQGGEEGESRDGDQEGGEDEDASPPSTGTVTGVVYIDDTPLAFGTIQVVDTNHRVIRQVRGGVTGQYRIDDLPPGTYILRYMNSAGVLFPPGVEVYVRAGEVTVADIRLSSSE